MLNYSDWFNLHWLICGRGKGALRKYLFLIKDHFTAVSPHKGQEQDGRMVGKQIQCHIGAIQVQTFIAHGAKRLKLQTEPVSSNKLSL